MMNNNAWEKVEELLVEADFYRRDHRLIFRAMGTIRVGLIISLNW